MIFFSEGYRFAAFLAFFRRNGLWLHQIFCIKKMILRQKFGHFNVKQHFLGSKLALLRLSTV